MNRSVFVLSIVGCSLFTGFIGMILSEGTTSLAIAGFLLPLIGMLACWYYDWSKK